MNVQTIIGQRFGRLVALREDGSLGKDQAIACRCDCGATHRTRAHSLIYGRVKSCGCFKRDRSSETNRVHGATETQEYRIWSGMKTRCFNTTRREYRFYGARGITVCDRWVNGEDGKTGFECFLADLGSRPSERHSLERDDNDGPYSPQNCRWATKPEQLRNRRGTVLISHNGLTKTAEEWSQDTGIAASEIRRRIKRGWAPARALTQAPREVHR